MRVIVEDFFELSAVAQAAEIRERGRRHHVRQQDEAACVVISRFGLVVVLHHDVTHLHSFERVHRLIERAEHLPCWVAHQIVADKAGGIGEAVWKRGIGREQEQARCFNGVRRQHHKLCVEFVFVQSGVEIAHAGHAPARGVVIHPVDKDLTQNAGAELLRFGQVSIRCRGFRLGAAAGTTPAAIGASGASVVLDGVDRHGRCERLCAQLPRTTRKQLRVPVEAMRRHRQRILLRRARPALASHTKLAFDLRAMRTQVIVAERPVHANAFRGLRAKIFAMKSRHDAEPRQRAAAEAGSGLRHHAIFPFVNARIGPEDFPRVRLGILKIHASLKSFARFEHGDGEAALREFLRHEAATRASADDDHVSGLRCHWECGRLGTIAGDVTRRRARP